MSTQRGDGPPALKLIVKHVFRKGNGAACDVAGCGRLMSDVIHHIVDKSEGDAVLPTTIKRSSRDDMLVSIAEIVRERSTCLRGQVGVVIGHNGRIISMGYNGSPPGMDHCLDVGCEPSDPVNEFDLVTDEDRLSLFGCQRTIHAEANAIAWAARAGTPIAGTTMYSTHSPCGKCAQLIVSAGIGRFVYTRSYRAERLDILEAGNVKIVQFGGH